LGREKGDCCKKCGEIGKHGEKWIECEMCVGWFHIRCQELTATLVNWIEKGRDKGMHWFCTGCNEGAVRALKFGKVVTDRQDKMETDILVMRKELEDMKLGLQKQVVSYAGMVGMAGKSTIVDQEGGGGGVRVADRKFQIQVSEAMEIERRKCNVVFLGVEDNEDEKADKEIVYKVLDALGVEREEMVEYGGRIGKKGTKEGYKRPIRIKLEKVDVKKRMLARSGKLRVEEDLKNVYITGDLTWKQLEGSRMVRYQCRKFREEGKIGVRIDVDGQRVVQQLQGGETKVLFQLEEC
jgi:hypothetical protein